MTETTPAASDNSINPFRLDGRVAIVTGGGGGLGGGICAALAVAGATVAVVGRTREKLERVAESVTDGGGRALAVEVDIADEASVAAMTERVVDAFGGIDILVNNAATNPYMGPTLDIDPEIGRAHV